MAGAGFIGVMPGRRRRKPGAPGGFAVTLSGLTGVVAEEGSVLGYSETSPATPSAQRWQTSPDSVTWSDIPGGNAETEVIDIAGSVHGDGSYIRVGVTISGVERFSNTARVLYAPPLAAGALADQSFTANGGVQTYDVSGDFTGEDLTYSINSVTGVSIAASTGAISFDTDVMAEQSGTPIVVSGTNSGGSAQSGFSLDIQADVTTDFVLTVETTTANEPFNLKMRNAGTYNATIEWGDGQSSTITAYDDADLVHTYASAGTHTIRMAGQAGGPLLGFSPDKAKVRTVENFGDLSWTHISDGFSGCTGMTSFRFGNTDTSAITNWFAAFKQCSAMTVCDLTGASFAACTNLQSTWANCAALLSIDFTIVTSTGASPRRADECFYLCPNLVGLDPSGLDVTNFTDFGNYTGGMFNFIEAPAFIETAVYDQMLINFAAQNFATGVVMDVQQSMPTLGGTAEAARTALVNGNFKIEDAISTVPGQMAAPNAVVVSDTELQVNLAADPFSDIAISQYDIRWSNNGGSSWTEALDFTDGGSVTGLPPGDTVEVQARAVNWFGNGAWSASDTETMLTGSLLLENVGEEPVITADSGNISVTLASGPYAGTYTTNHLGATLTVAMVEAAPTWLTKPSISGNIGLGDILTILPGLVLYSGPDLGDQTWTWDRDGAPISGETLSTHTVAAADQGTDLNVPETYGGVTVESDPISIPAAANSPAAFAVGDWTIIDNGDGSLAGSFAAMPADNGFAITNTHYSVDGAPLAATGVSAAPNSFTIPATELQIGVSANIAVFAENSEGIGTSSDVKVAMPTTVPNAPDSVDGWVPITGSGPAEAIIQIQEVPFSGGKPLAEFEYDVDADDTWRSVGGAALGSYTVSAGLTAGGTHDLRLRARNANGPGSASTALSVTAGAAAGITNPEADDAGLHAWYDPSDTSSVVVVNTNETRWINDKKGTANLGRGAAQGPVYDPGVVAHQQNGLDTAHLDVLTDRKKMRTAQFPIPSGDHVWHIATVIDGHNDVMSSPFGVGLGGNDFQFRAGHASIFNGELQGSGTTIASTNGPHSGLTIVTVEIDRTSGEWTLIVDGVNMGTAPMTFSAAGNVTFTWGANRQGHRDFQGKLCEAICTTDLTLSDDYQAYLANKWRP
jgi:hypothetical protein